MLTRCLEGYFDLRTKNACEGKADSGGSAECRDEARHKFANAAYS